MQKIDKALIDQVGILSENGMLECIVFLKCGVFSFVCLKNIVGKNGIIKHFPFINAVLVRIKRKDLSKLCSFSFVEYVSSIQKASILLYNSRKFLKINKVHQMGITGFGVTVAVIDTGCHPHLDFCLGRNRLHKFCDFVHEKQLPYDDNGHGTFVCGVLCGNGLVLNGKYMGIAPQANLIAIKALNEDGETTAKTILSAMQWVLDNKDKERIKVVCMSFGSTPLENNDPLMEGAKILWENGICVVCAGGNDGPEGKSIKSPGSCPNVITVGSITKLEEKKLKVAPFSSRGPAFDYIKPDILAPGVEIYSTINNNNFYSKMTGTSVSTPFIAGICALMLQRDKSLAPNDIKRILMENASKIDDEQNACGSGVVNIENIFFN